MCKNSGFLLSGSHMHAFGVYEFIDDYQAVESLG